MFRSQRIIIREYVCTSLKLLNYLKKTLNLTSKTLKFVSSIYYFLLHVSIIRLAIIK